MLCKRAWQKTVLLCKRALFTECSWPFVAYIYYKYPTVFALKFPLLSINFKGVQAKTQAQAEAKNQNQVAAKTQEDGKSPIVTPISKSPSLAAKGPPAATTTAAVITSLNKPAAGGVAANKLVATVKSTAVVTPVTTAASKPNVVSAIGGTKALSNVDASPKVVPTNVIKSEPVKKPEGADLSKKPLAMGGAPAVVTPAAKVGGDASVLGKPSETPVKTPLGETGKPKEDDKKTVTPVAGGKTGTGSEVKIGGDVNGKVTDKAADPAATTKQTSSTGVTNVKK